MKMEGPDPSTQLHALFPTLVFQASLQQHQSFAAAFESVKDEFSFRPSSNSTARYNAGEYHGQILLHQSATLRPFFQELARQVRRYLQVLRMRSELFDMQCLKSWFVLVDPEDDDSESSTDLNSTDHISDHALLPHTHSCSDVSWVYYLDLPDDSVPITFHHPGLPATAPFSAAFHYDWHDDRKSAINSVNWWNSTTWSIHPKVGDLLLFPGHQLHSVQANFSNQRRVSVAGDLALTLRPEYRHLEFGRTAVKHWTTFSLNDDSSPKAEDEHNSERHQSVNNGENT